MMSPATLVLRRGSCARFALALSLMFIRSAHPQQKGSVLESCDVEDGCACAQCCGIANATLCRECNTACQGDWSLFESLIRGHPLFALLLAATPYLGRLGIDYAAKIAYKRLGCESSTKSHGEFRSCLDRPFVQKELRWAKQYHRPIITVFEEERRRAAFFDYALAWKKYCGTEWEYILNVDSVTYRRDTHEAKAMLQRILAKRQRSDAGGNSPVAPLNQPGYWDFCE